jgi:hypothetical protein
MRPMRLPISQESKTGPTPNLRAVAAAALQQAGDPVETAEAVAVALPPTGGRLGDRGPGIAHFAARGEDRVCVAGHFGPACGGRVQVMDAGLILRDYRPPLLDARRATACARYASLETQDPKRRSHEQRVTRRKHRDAALREPGLTCRELEEQARAGRFT